MVKFSAFQSAKVSDAKALNVTKDVSKNVSIEEKILALLKRMHLLLLLKWLDSNLLIGEQSREPWRY